MLILKYMTEKEIHDFVEYYKTTDDFKNLPEDKKPIHIAMIIKMCFKTRIRPNKTKK